ncbi:MAG TPA: hypothetical protein VEZ90_17595, partial [Blastocatellia bacterium]|nr:hypothetical protein [Blastocatellia bacterium]
KIEDSGDAIVCKLVSSKQTFVHRKLWSALASIGISNEPWQIQGLATTAKQLLKTISKTGEVRTDEVSLEQAADRKSVQAAVRELERRLLVCSEEVHTESGAHAKVLTT